jgi:hypothetical protein
MKLLKELSRKEFMIQFGTKDQCLMHLADQKWSAGFECRKCGNHDHTRGRTHGGRRCKKCDYDESPTAHTLFHKLKFGIENAFEMLYEIATSKKGANSIWLAERTGVRQTTAWLFRRKVQTAMESSKKHPMNGIIHVDEFEIGTPKKGEQGRSKSESKIRIILAVEYRAGKCGRGYAKVITDYSAKSLKPLFDDHVDKNAKIVADGWTGYKPLKAEYPNLTQQLSDKGRNFPMIHYQIRNFKNWLRGVHSYCDNSNMDAYIQEYFFRFNRRNHRESILSKILERMTNHCTMTFNQLKISGA